MRIACVHIPQFALQCATRVDPSLRRPEPGAPIVVVGAGVPSADRALHAPVVLACSRAAWALGARVGMTGTTARQLSPEIEVVTADAQLERDTTRAIADVLLGLSPVVDLGGRVGPGAAHLALYCEVPAKTRGTTFGDRLLERLESLGLTGRIGIADDRFTAWVAAWLGGWDAPHEESNISSVPRGGSAAFLAPRPLSLLSISPEVQHMLEALGVRTLGEFAALPSPTVSTRGNARLIEADYQALARGESGNVLRPYAPDAPIREEAVIRPLDWAPLADGASKPGLDGVNKPSTSATAAISHDTQSAAHGTHAASFGASHGMSGPAAVALLAERVAMRLHGRARSAARLELTVSGGVGERVIPIAPLRSSSAGVLASAESIAEAIGTALGDLLARAWRLRVVVIGEGLAGDKSSAADAADALEAPKQRALLIARAPTITESQAGVEELDPLDAREAAAIAAADARAVADTLSLVLSSTGSSVFGLTSPNSVASERRDDHRRMRRGKQRRRSGHVTGPLQPRLFKT